MMSLIYLVVIAGAAIIGVIACSNEGYKNGQVDALRGKIKYRKEENERGETVWTKIKEPTPPKG